jgi:hypothetical protein
MVGKKYWYVMYYIMYQYLTLDTNIKFASTGDRTRIACVTGGHSTQRAIKTKYTSDVDLGCLSRIRDPTFFPSRIPIRPVSIPDPGSRIRIKEFKYFNPQKTKKWFLISRKYYPSCSSRIPDPDADFLPIPDPGSRGQKGTGSRIPTTPHPLNTSSHKTAARRPHHPSYTQQHYTTALGYIKLPMYL